MLDNKVVSTVCSIVIAYKDQLVLSLKFANSKINVIIIINCTEAHVTCNE